MNLAHLTLPVRISLLSLVITLTGVITIALVAYTYSDKMLVQEELRALEQKVSREAAAIRQKFETILQDAHFLNQSDPVKGIARALQNDGYDDEENMTLPLWEKRLATLFSTVMTQRNIYSQMRLILADEAGQEVVRVDRVDNRIIILTPDKLQKKGHRDYFQAGLHLKPGQFYISEISLNREHGQITFPPTPMVRVVMPVYNRNEQLFALLVINANLLRLARNLLNHPPDIFYFLTNQHGDYLIHPDDKKAMAFEYDRAARIQQDYPAVTELIRQLQQNRKPTQPPIFNLLNQGIGLALDTIYYYPGHPERFLIVGGVEGLTALKEKSVTLRNQLLVLVLITSGVLALITFLVVRRLTEPLQLLNRAVEAVKKGRLDVKIPVTTSEDEIGSLARSFDDMLQKLAESQKALKEANVHLEKEVAERTQELEQAKRFLEAQNQELSKALEQAKEADKAKSRFLAMMSHEIRTPLNGILGLTELALQQQNLPERLRENLQAVHDSGKTLLTILNDILDFSKMEAGQLQLAPAPTNLNQLAEQVMRLYADMARNKHIALYLHPAPGIAHHVWVDADRLRQILMNLMSNAIKFTDKGHVILRLRLLNHRDQHISVRFEVEDTGPGIPASEKDRLFKEFSQLDEYNARRHGGTGLGLSIARRLAKMMHARIGVDSELGRGSLFYVELTLKYGEPLNEPPAELLAALKGRMLAIHSDSAVQMDIWRDVLPEYGLVIRETRSLEALSTLKEVDGLLIDTDRTTQLEQLPQSTRAHCVLLTERVDQLTCPHYLSRPLLYSQLIRMLGLIWGHSASYLDKNPESPEQHDTNLEHLRILLVEDVPVNQQVALGMLSSLGIKTVTVANNGYEAIDAFKCGQFDLVLMDLQMPEMDGYEALKAIRKYEHAHGCTPTPVIALTAHALLETQQSIHEAGFEDILTKPLSLEALKAMLQRHAPKVAPVKVQAEQPNNTQPLLDDNTLSRLKTEIGDITPVLNLFETELAEMAQKLRAYQDGGSESVDLEALARLAHRLKGSSRNLGALALGEASEQLEKAAKNNSDWTDKIRSLQTLIEQTRQQIREKLDTMT